MRYDEKIVSPEDVAKGVTGLGYKCHHTRTVGPKDGRGGGSGASLSTLEVEVTGMSCTSCSGKVGPTESRHLLNILRKSQRPRRYADSCVGLCCFRS